MDKIGKYSEAQWSTVEAHWMQYGEKVQAGWKQCSHTHRVEAGGRRARTNIALPVVHVLMVMFQGVCKCTVHELRTRLLHQTHDVLVPEAVEGARILPCTR